MQNQQSNEGVVTFVGPDPDGMGECTYAIHHEQLRALDDRGKQVKLSQLFGIVEPGLRMAQPIFQGARRPLNYDGNQEGDRAKLFLTLRPRHDFDWSPTSSSLPEIVRKDAPQGCVYVVLATPNVDESYPEVDFWIENWCWVDESTGRPGYPIDSDNRFDQEKTRTP